MTRLVGINHIALEVGDIDDALEWYGRLFEVELRGRARLADGVRRHGRPVHRAVGRTRAEPDDRRHFGLVVDDKEAVRGALHEAGVPSSPSGSVDFSDPWGNHVQVVDYRDIQFTKAPEVLQGMGLEGLGKSDSALGELRSKGLAGAQG